MPEGLPSTIGQYQIQAELGRGGFGRVYRGYDPKVGRPVAVKVLTEGSKELLTRFRNEAAVAGNLRHKNIVTVYEFGEHEGRPFLAMEYLEGENLSHVIASHKPLTVLQKTTIMAQVADGLYCAHRNGVVHRDVKPANIMLLLDGTVKIMDFGIARLTRDNEATRLTQQGYMLGTLLYMAPEQFTGSDVDALCDIFAYGVIYYELLTGHHPFEAPDARSLMYKISFDDPAPVRSLLPECPEALERVIAKLLHKERELRYQSLKEAQFDTEPVRIDLQQERAARLLVEAQELFAKKQLDPAQTVILEALSLDPSNKGARALYENLQKQLQQRVLQPRIEALLKSAEEQLGQRRFSDAIQSFESALRLDRDNVYVQSRLEQARSLADHAKRAAQLLAEARLEFNRHNISTAFKDADEALRLDPRNPEAGALMRSIQEAMEQRQRERRIEEAIGQAEGLLLQHSYDEAAAVLTALESGADSPKVERLLEWIRSQKTEHERRQRFQSEMAAATALLKERRFADAVRSLEALAADFPGDEEVAHLLQYSRQGLAAQERARAVEKLAGDARAHLDSYDFPAALKLLDDGLKTYPGESALVRLLAGAVASKADWDRQQTVRNALLKCEGLRREKRFAEALDAAEAALREYSAEPALLDLVSSLEKEWEEHKRAEAVAQALAAAGRLLDAGQPGRAAELLRQASGRYPGEPALASLLARAQAEQEALERARAIEAAAREAHLRAENRDFIAARDILDRALATWPGEAVLTRERESVLTAQAAFERRQAVTEAARRARDLGRQLQFAEAIQLLDAALSRYSGETELADARAEISRGWEQYRRAEAVARGGEEARRAMIRDRFPEAVKLLEDAVARYPGEPELEMLLAAGRHEVRARERIAAVEALSAEVRERAASSQFDRAIEILEQGLRQWPREAVLLRLLESTQAARAAWQREQAIAEVARHSTHLAGQNQFAEALRLLDTSLRQYPGEPSLTDLRARCEAAWEQQKRREAIARAVAEATALLDRERLDDAARKLREAAARFPDEPELEAVLARAQREIEARDRAAAIRKIAADAQARVAAHDFDTALALLDSALAAYPGESALVSLRKAVVADQKKWEQEQARLRAEAIEKLAAQARAEAEAHNFERAREILEQGLRAYPDAGSLAGLREELRVAQAAWKRRQAVAETARRADALLRQEQFQPAVTALQEALARWPGERELEDLLARARQAIQARERAAAIEKLATEALARSQAGNFDAAFAGLEQALATYPGEAPLLAARDRISAARADWLRRQEEEAERRRRRERAAAIEKLADDARARSQAGDFDAALAILEQALATYPGEAPLLTARKDISAAQAEARLRERAAAIDKLAADARARSQAGDFDTALALLEEALTTHPGEAPLLAARDAVSAAQAEARRRQRAAAIDKLAADARARSQAGDFEAALTILDQALTTYPSEAPLVAARKDISAAQAEARRRERAAAIDNLAAEARARSQAGDFDGALLVLEQALVAYPGEAALQSARDAVSAARDQWQLRERHLAELRAIQDEAPTAEPARAAELLPRARDLAARYPDDREIAAAAQDALAHLTALQDARREFAAANWTAVLDLCRRNLARYPDHPVFAALQAEAGQRQRAAAIDEARRRAAAEPDLEARARLLEEALRTFPSERSLEDDLRFTRNKLGLVQSVLEEARACEQGERWDEALERWNSLKTIYPAYPALAAETARLARRRDEARAAAVTRWCAQVEAALAAADLPRAADLLRQAQAEFPDAPELAPPAARLEQARARKAQAQALLAQGQQACQKGRYPDGASLLRQAFELDPSDPAFRKQVLEALLKAARAAVKSAWHDAQTLVAQARALQPDWAVPGDLQRAIDNAQREEIVTGCLDAAGRLQHDGRLHDALNELDRGLLAYSGEPRLHSARQALATELVDRRRRALDELRALDETGRTLTDIARIEALAANARQLAAQLPAEAEVQALGGEVARHFDARLHQLRAEARRARLAALRKPALAAAAGLVVVIGAYLGIRALLRRPPAIAFEVAASPSAASVRIGGQVCPAPPCRFKLPPGRYSLEISLDGYVPVTRPVTLDAANPAPPPLNVALDPLRAAVQVSTNFPSGSVRLDGRSAGQLQNGELALHDLPFGRHELKVSGPDGEAGLRFETGPGKPPQLSGSVQAKDLEAVLVSNLGATARLDCNCGAQKVTLDGQSAGQTGPAGLELRGLAPGTRTLKLGEGGGQQDFVFSVGPAPSLNVFVNANRNVGTLVIEANVENATVLINGRKSGTTGRDLLRIPLDVNEYTVTLQKNGYESEAPQRADIRKGGTTRLLFTLAPKGAALDLRGALPDTQVLVDGKAVGTVPAGGRFTTGVKSGDHVIGFAKNGYLAKQIRRRFEPGETVRLEPSDVTLAPDPRVQEEAAQKAEQTAWDRVNKNDRASLRQFQSAWPNSRHAQDAKDALARLDELDRERADTQRKAEQARQEQAKLEQQKQEQARQEQAKLEQAKRDQAKQEKAKADELALQQQRQLQADRQAIQAAIAAYGHAMDSKSIKDLQAVYPVIPKDQLDTYRNAFKEARSISTQLEMAGEPQIAGDRASVVVQSTTTTTFSGQKPIPVRRRVRFSLHRASGRWLIDATENLQ